MRSEGGLTETNAINDERSLTGAQVVTKYYRAGGALVGMREGAILTTLFTDHLGSTTVSLTGGTATQQRYKPCPQGVLREGEVRGGGNSLPTDNTYTGQKTDEPLGLMFYNARWYDPVLGRFAQADTYMTDIYNPLDLDRYQYVRSNPVNFNDPSGHVQACADGDEGGDCGQGSTVADFLGALKEIYNWDTTGNWNLLQSFYLYIAGSKLESYVTENRNGDSVDAIKRYFGGITFTTDDDITRILNSSVTLDSKTIHLIAGFETVNWEQGVVGHVIHETGHILDNRVGDLWKGEGRFPADIVGGGPADYLYKFMEGEMLEYFYLRFTGGILMPEKNRFSDLYPYGNNSPADYFAHTLSISIVDRKNVPQAASMWLGSLISLLP